MPKKVSDQIKDATEEYLQQSYNRLIKTIMRRLATKKRSPVYTGFFASSWKVDTSPIQSVDQLVSPWLELSKKKWTNPSNKEYKIEPRFYPPDKAYNYKRRVYIGNTAEYAIYALEDGRVQQFVQGGEMKALVEEAFKDRQPNISVGGRQATGQFGTMAGRTYTGYTEL